MYDFFLLIWNLLIIFKFSGRKFIYDLCHCNITFPSYSIIEINVKYSGMQIIFCRTHHRQCASFTSVHQSSTLYTQHAFQYLTQSPYRLFTDATSKRQPACQIFGFTCSVTYISNFVFINLTIYQFEKYTIRTLFNNK